MLSVLVKRLQQPSLSEATVIPWSCPIPSFGDLSTARVATLGLNPSNREFLDSSGKELEGPARRFHTLRSLRLVRWSDATARHLRLVAESCLVYFSRNPYDGWFRKLDYLISGTAASYYSTSRKACHLDLIPFATARKWAALSASQRTALFTVTGDALALLLRDSPVSVLILNGRSVVEQFQNIAGTPLEVHSKPNWSLPRRAQRPVGGFGYRGVVSELSGVKLNREILIVGFNHNIQSSYGVTTSVVTAMRLWIARATAGVIS
jgi:hypothetical protein